MKQIPGNNGKQYPHPFNVQTIEKKTNEEENQDKKLGWNEEDY